jgi:hypothetical protein
MTDDKIEKIEKTIEENTTGLPWPKSWKSAYILVAASFALWLALLVMLGTIGQ